MPLRALAAAFLLLTALTAHGQWREDGDVVEDVPWRGSDGEFGAMLVLTPEPEAFLEQWSRPAAPGYVPRIETTSEADRGDVVAAMILWARCAPEASGGCHVVADFRVLRPDGSTYAEHPGAVLWRGAPPHSTALQLGQSHLGLEIEPDDPVGVYRIQATVRDLVARRSVALVQELRVGPPE